MQILWPTTEHAAPTPGSGTFDATTADVHRLNIHKGSGGIVRIIGTDEVETDEKLIIPSCHLPTFAISRFQYFVIAVDDRFTSEI